MKNKILGIYAVPVALLLMAGGIAVPQASADTKREPVSGVFVYDRNAPAETIYARLHRTAEKLCAYPGARGVAKRRPDDVCVASVIDNAVQRMGRSDIALIHSHANG